MLADVLAHHGVKGMHWGDRKGSSEESTSPKSDKKAAKVEAKNAKVDAKNLAKADDRIAKHQNIADIHNRRADNYEKAFVDVNQNGLKSQALQAKYGLAAHHMGDRTFAMVNGKTKERAITEHLNLLSSRAAWERNEAMKHENLVKGLKQQKKELSHAEYVEYLTHHGIKGMKWGNRKGSSESSSPSKISDDYAKAEANKKVVKEHGTKALSNKELQDLVTRMNLEQQHRNLVNNSAKPTKFESGKKKIDAIIGVGRTLNDLNNLAKSPVGKAVKTGLKTAKAANAAKKIVEEVAE